MKHISEYVPDAIDQIIANQAPDTRKDHPVSILTEAEALIHGQRRDDYGSPLESFDTIARLWAPVLGVDVTAEQVALCMVGLKVARAMQGFHRDSLVDIAGYAGCLELIHDERAAA